MARLCPECGSRHPDPVLFCPDDGTPTYQVTDTSELVGREIDGRYTLLSVLGQGGMGIVYRARQRSMERDVAVKLLRPNVVDDDQAVRRFFREVQAASRLKSPHVVTVHDFGQARDGQFYLAMELVDGRSLESLMGPVAGPMPPARAACIVDQVLEVLDEAHGHGIVHRDLKPQNILVSGPDDFVKVLDFGLARIPARDESRVTGAGSVLGTPAYMSPEQALAREVDGRSDLYSVGLLLFEMLTGRPPFEGDSALTLLMQRLQDRAPAVRAFGPADVVNDRLEALIHALLEREPAARPVNAAEVRRLLREALGASMPRVEAGAGIVFSPEAPRVQEADRLARMLVDALALEEEGRIFYELAADRCTSGPARHLFRHLMEEEVGHTATFRALYLRVKGGEADFREIDQVEARHPDLSEVIDAWAATRLMEVREDITMRDALAVAIDFERRVVDFWERQVSCATSVGEHRFVHAMVNEERGHVATLSQIQALFFGIKPAQG